MGIYPTFYWCHIIKLLLPKWDNLVHRKCTRRSHKEILGIVFTHEVTWNGPDPSQGNIYSVDCVGLLAKDLTIYGICQSNDLYTKEPHDTKLQHNTWLKGLAQVLSFNHNINIG